MTRRILTLLALPGLLLVPSLEAQRFRGAVTYIQVYLGNFPSLSAWSYAHRRSARYCKLDHYRSHRRYQRGCNICGHNRHYHGHYLNAGGDYYDRYGRGPRYDCERWVPDNRYYGRDFRRGYGRYDDDDWDDDWEDRRRRRYYRDDD